MSVLRLDAVRATFDHRCAAPGCGAVRRGLRLDPAAGDITIWRSVETGAVTALVLRACPLCQSQESLNPDLPAWEAQEIDPATSAVSQHPGSLVGQTFAATRAVVTEHSHGYLPTPDHVAAARLVRQMQRHPLIAPHAPLVELHPARYAALLQRLATTRASQQTSQQTSAAAPATTDEGGAAAPLAGDGTPDGPTPASHPAAGTAAAAPEAAAPPPIPAS